MDETKLKILVATDLTEASDAAVRYAASLLAPLEATLTLLHIIEPIGGDTVFVAEYSKDIQKALARLAELRDELNLPENLCDIQTEVGFPAERIKHTIETGGYSIVVMGMEKDLSSIDRDVFGSNAYDVIKRGLSPVLTIPENCSSREPKKIVMAVSLEMNENIYLLSLVKRIASFYKSEITLLHVTTEEHVVLENKKANAIHWLKEQLDHLDFHFSTISSKHVPDAIALFVEENESDLLIMSPETQNFISRIFQGSTTRKTLMHLHTPLLTFPVDYL